MLATEICVTSSGTPTALANLMSPSTSIALNSPKVFKHKRKAPADFDIGHAEENTTQQILYAEHIGSVWAIDP